MNMKAGQLMLQEREEERDEENDEVGEIPDESPPLRDPDHLSLRIGRKGRENSDKLTALAGYEKKSQFYKALISHLTKLANGKTFDIRDLTFKEANK